MNILEKILALPTHLRGHLMSDPERNGEYRFLNELFKKADENDVFFDVGANIGEYSHKLLSFDGQINIHAFEPIPSTFEVLKDNLSNTHVVINNVALSSESKDSIIYEYGELKASNSLEYHPNLNQQNLVKREVKLMTTDDYCRAHNIENIRFMKVDVEGHEVPVLRGAIGMIKSGRIQCIQFEYNYLWKNTSFSLRDAFEILEDQYKLFRLTTWGKISIHKYHPKHDIYPSASNYVAILK